MGIVVGSINQLTLFNPNQEQSCFHPRIALLKADTYSELTATHALRHAPGDTEMELGTDCNDSSSMWSSG